MRSLLARPFATLPAKIITVISATTFVTSLAVAWIATGSTESFLRARIDERFPLVIERVAERIDTWYGQRLQDLETFATSDTLILGLAPDADRSAREETRRYLAYVQKGFPQYRSLFVIDDAGEVQIRVGETWDLRESLRARLLRDAPSGLPITTRLGNTDVQLLSAPIETDAGPIGRLFAALDLAAVETLLGPGELEGSARLMLLTAAHSVLVATDGLGTGEHYARAVALGDDGAVHEYRDARDVKVVGISRALERFDWRLVLEESYADAFAPVVSMRWRVLALNFAIVIFFGAIAFMLARSIAQPIRALADGARRIAAGEEDIALPESGGSEIRVLSRVLSEMVESLRQKKQALVVANEELRRNNEVLEQLSYTDGLTRLHNHRYFQDRFRHESSRAQRTQEPLALLLVDIDDFKALNDRHGHAKGDVVLRGLGEVLNLNVRGTDLPARYGGEEFAVLAPGTDRDGAIFLAEKLCNAVREAEIETDEGELLAVTCSIGVTIFAGDTKQTFEDADRALYRAKADGKDCVVCAWDL